MRDGGKKLVRTSDGGEGRPVDRRHRTQAMGEEGVGERERGRERKCFRALLRRVKVEYLGRREGKGRIRPL